MNLLKGGTSIIRTAPFLVEWARSTHNQITVAQIELKSIAGLIHNCIV